MSRSKERVVMPRFRSSHSEWTGLPLGLVGLNQASTSSLRTRGVHTKEPEPAMKDGLLTPEILCRRSRRPQSRRAPAAPGCCAPLLHAFQEAIKGRGGSANHKFYGWVRDSRTRP